MLPPRSPGPRFFAPRCRRARPKAALKGALSVTLLIASLGCSSRPEPVPIEAPPPLPPGCPSFHDLSVGLPTSRGWRTNPALGDVNGDGYLDLAATTRKGEGPKVFLFKPPDEWIDSSEGIEMTHYPCGVGMELVDINADGALDLLAADHCSGLHLFLGDGSGSWRRLANLQHATGEGFNDVAAGDIDGDGRVDLVALSAFTKGLSLYLQEGDGSFSLQETNLPSVGGGFDVNLLDLDGDGDLDISTTLRGITHQMKAHGEREVKVWLQQSATEWRPVADLPENGDYYGIASGDINGDGRIDLVISRSGYDGGVPIYLGTAPGSWRLAPGTIPGKSPGRSFNGVALHDLNGDGNLDLLAVERRVPALVAWIGDGAGGFTECPGAFAPLSDELRPGWGLAVGDINGDGAPDITAGFGSEGGGALRAWTAEPQ